MTKLTGTRSPAEKRRVPSRRIINLVYESVPGKKVFAAGSFNDWKPEKELKDSGNTGVYRAQLRLEPGEYQYKFVVNGNWCLDAENPRFIPNDFGTLNSVLVVKSKEEVEKQ